MNTFEIIDKTGRTIRLTKRQWSHIMKKHPYMNKHLEGIKETLQYPQKLLTKSFSKSYYFRYYKSLQSPNQYILVIVKYLNGTGFVITAYLTEKIK